MKKTIITLITLITCISLHAQEGKQGGESHEYVDLGLPSGTLWATCNIGASKPEEYGNYFAWGETEPKDSYKWSTYKWCNGSDSTMTKYCTDSKYGTVDNKKELLPEDDAATANWGNDWCMPSLEQFEELYNPDYTTADIMTLNGVKGRKLTSKKNGKSIFLPAAGYRNNTSIVHAGIKVDYWTRSLITTSCNNAYYRSYIVSAYYPRLVGLPVRPVRKEKVPTKTSKKKSAVMDASSLLLEKENNTTPREIK